MFGTRTLRMFRTYGSPMTKLSPALMDGTNPNEPTKAAAPSLPKLGRNSRRSNGGPGRTR